MAKSTGAVSPTTHSSRTLMLLYRIMLLGLLFSDTLVMDVVLVVI